TEAEEVARGEGARQVAREVDDELLPQRPRALHARGRYHYRDPQLTDRSVASEEKRRLLLDAAVRVFARKGYHTCRVGDIAEEAGVAHGLLYHYFSSKEEVLETVFRDTWLEIVGAAHRVEQSDETARERLAGVAKILLRAW